MAIAIHCPHCQAAYRLADDQAGKAVRCRGCKQAFDVPGPPPAARAGTHRLDRSVGVRPPAAPPALPPAEAALPTALPGREPERRDDRERERPPRRRAEDEGDLPLPPADNRAVLWIAAGLGGAAVLVLASCAGLIWYVSTQVGRGVDRMVARARQGQPPITITVDPPIVNQFEALTALRSPVALRRQRGAEFLGRQVPDRDPLRRQQVRDALAPLLQDSDFAVRHAALHATNVWR